MSEETPEQLAYVYCNQQELFDEYWYCSAEYNDFHNEESEEEPSYEIKDEAKNHIGDKDKDTDKTAEDEDPFQCLIPLPRGFRNDAQEEDG